jgi:hypothetical protein
MVRDTLLQSCIDNCTRCYAICTTTLEYSIEKSGLFAEANQLRRLQDCAQMCATSLDFMLRGSDLHPYTCGVCAQACDRCAQSCEQLALGTGDQVLKDCAETCKRCAETCHEMSKRGHKAASASTTQ